MVITVVLTCYNGLMHTPLDLWPTTKLLPTTKTSKASPVACINSVSAHCKISIVRNEVKAAPGRLYLWGEPFGVGDLDKALSQSYELRENVLERLGHIGELVLRGKAFSIVN